MEAVRRAVADAGGGVSKSDVLAATGLSAGQWNTAVSTLLAEGAIIKTGAKRGTRYFLKD